MSPEVKTGLRRIGTVIALAGQGGIAYMLHSFAGWQRTAMTVLCLALMFVTLRLAIAEGRARERGEH